MDTLRILRELKKTQQTRDDILWDIPYMDSIVEIMGITWSDIKLSPYMMTSSNGSIFRVTGPLCGEFTGHRWIPLTKASDAELWSFFDLRLNKQFNKQSIRWWFGTPLRPVWRHCNGKYRKSHSVKIRRSYDCFVSTIVIHILVRRHLYIKSNFKLFASLLNTSIICFQIQFWAATRRTLNIKHWTSNKPFIPVITTSWFFCGTHSFIGDMATEQINMIHGTKADAQTILTMKW